MLMRFSGVFGVVVFLFGFIGSLLIGTFDNPLLFLHMVIGAISLVFWFFSFGLKNLNQAGADSVLRGRSTRFTANALLYSVVFIGLLGVIYYLAHEYDKRWDLTESGVYSLAPQSANAISRLSEKLSIVAFTGVSRVDEEGMKQLINLYKLANPDIVDSKVIDARTKPYLLDQYEMKPGNVIYLSYGEGDKKAVSRLNETTEQAVTNAIIKLTRGAAKKIYYVIGHDEPDLKDDEAGGLSGLAAAISDEHLTVETILLSQSATIPEDTAAIILCSPKKPLLAEEKALLKKYAEEGGRLLLLHDPKTTNDITEIAAHFNIEVGNDVIIDQVQKLFAAPSLGAQPIVRQYTPHATTKHLKDNSITIFNIASGLKRNTATGSQAVVTELAKTSPTSWAEKDLDRLFSPEGASATFENGVDTPGPVPIAMAYEKKLNSEKSKEGSGDQGEKEVDFDKSARVVVFGDSDWVLNANLAVYANRDFILSTVNWLVGEEGGVSIGKRDMRMSDAPMTQQDFVLLLTSSFLLPELILISGLFIWWRRRQALGV